MLPTSVSAAIGLRFTTVRPSRLFVRVLAVVRPGRDTVVPNGRPLRRLHSSISKNLDSTSNKALTSRTLDKLDLELRIYPAANYASSLRQPVETLRERSLRFQVWRIQRWRCMRERYLLR